MRDLQDELLLVYANVRDEDSTADPEGPDDEPEPEPDDEPEPVLGQKDPVRRVRR